MVSPLACRDRGIRFSWPLGTLVSRLADKQEFQLSYPNTVQSPDLRRLDASIVLSTRLNPYSYVNYRLVRRLHVFVFLLRADVSSKVV